MSANLDKSLTKSLALTKQEVIEPVSVVLVVTVQEELVSKLVANVGAFQTEEALSEKILGHLQTQSLELPSSWTPLERSRSTSKVCQGTLSRML